jgi:glutaredoxin 3
MSDYTIYSKPGCTYCEQAKSLLASKNLSYTELILDVGQVKDPAKQYYTVAQLKEKVPEARTVPQIFKGTTLIGGYDSLKQRLA